jgi:hypothetical protein
VREKKCSFSNTSKPKLEHEISAKTTALGDHGKVSNGLSSPVRNSLTSAAAESLKKFSA